MEKDLKNPATPTESGADTHDEPIDKSRRRLATAGLGAAVLMTVANRPAMAGYKKGCTLSAWMSAGSGPTKPTCYGRSCSSWKTKYSSWPSPCYKGGYSGSGSWGGGWSYSSDNTSSFKSCFGSVYPPGQYLGSKSLLQVLSDDPTGTKLGAQAVAALLNAADDNIPYGYTVSEVIALYKNNVTTNPTGLYNTFKLLNERVA